MSGDRVPRGASPAAPRLLSTLLRSSSPSLLQQPQQRGEATDDLPQTLAVACALRVEPASLPVQQPMASRNFATHPGPRAHRQSESDDEPGLQVGAGSESPTAMRARLRGGAAQSRHQNTLEVDAGNSSSYPLWSTGDMYGSRRSDPGTVVGAAEAGAVALPVSLLAQPASSPAQSPSEAPADGTVSAAVGPNRSSLFLPSFENLEVPGADSTHRLGKRR